MILLGFRGVLSVAGRGEHVEERSDLVPFLGGMPEQLVGIYLVGGAASGPGADGWTRSCARSYIWRDYSIAGCFFYGAFAAKLVIVHSRRLPGWALPVAGGVLAIVIGVLWYTSALWFYDGYQLPDFNV